MHLSSNYLHGSWEFVLDFGYCAAHFALLLGEYVSSINYFFMLLRSFYQVEIIFKAFQFGGFAGKGHFFREFGRGTLIYCFILIDRVCKKQ